MRLGEMLVSAGKLTPAQVEETLKGQAIFGGRFGTNLVEMGYLDEHDLAHFLSKKTGIPLASPEQLMDVPPQLLRLIPEDAVRKYRVVPIALNNRKLTLAMTDPTDYATIDEISFVTGYIVVPVVTPELRLLSALEKHYHIKREVRYISVAGGSRSMGRLSAASAAEAQKQATPSRPAPGKPAPGGTRAIEPDDPEILELPMLADHECFGDIEIAEPVAPTPQPPRQQASGQQAPGQQASPPHREAEKDYSLDGVLRGLAQADDRQIIADLIINYAAQQFDRSALLMLKGGKATGWVAQRGKNPVPNFDELEIPLSEPSVLRVVSESKSHYLGPMPATHFNGKLIEALGGGTPMINLLVPLMMMGRVVAVLYVEGGTIRLDERVVDLQRLLGKGSMAFEILILKSKILLT